MSGEICGSDAPIFVNDALLNDICVVVQYKRATGWSIGPDIRQRSSGFKGLRNASIYILKMR